MTRLVPLAALGRTARGLAAFGWVALAPVTVHAQIALDAFNGTSETPVGAVYNYGNVAAGSPADVRFRVHDIGPSAVVLTGVSAAGN
jgi:hypothetical protein